MATESVSNSSVAGSTRYGTRGDSAASTRCSPRVPCPTGRQVTATGMSMVRVRDGKIVEGWNNWDMLGLMHQVSTVPHVTRLLA